MDDEVNLDIHDGTGALDDDQFFQIAEMKLRALERDYARTIAADIKQPADNFELKGKFENLSFNNIEFQNANVEAENEKTKGLAGKPTELTDPTEEPESKPEINEFHKNCTEAGADDNKEDKTENKLVADEDEDVEEEDDTCMYEKLAENDDDEGDREDDWEEPQQAVFEKKQADEQNTEKPLDVEKIKSIMAKINLPPPPWANNQDVWKKKCIEILKDNE